MKLDTDIELFHNSLSEHDKTICLELFRLVEANLKQAVGRVWHGQPVWFIDENPVVGYCIKKSGVELLFWSGQSFSEAGLEPVGKHKAAGVNFHNVSELPKKKISVWLKQASLIQWDYANLPKNRVLEKLTNF